MSATIGGLIGGGFTFLGVRVTIRNERRKALAAEESEIAAFKKAIATEIVELRRRYLESVGNKLAQQQNDRPFIGYYLVAEDYFTIFKSNAHLIGKIQDDALRADIVRTYTVAMGLLDSLRLNNALSEKYLDFDMRAKHTKLLYDEQQTAAFFNMLTLYTPKLLELHFELIRNIEDLLRKLV